MYEDIEPTRQNRLSTAQANEAELLGLTPAILATLPSDLLVNLEHATITTDMTMICKLIEQIRVHNSSVADALAQLAGEFEYLKILACLQQAKKLKDCHHEQP